MSAFLQDKIFISTRPEGQSDQLARLFSGVGATLIEMPAIKIQPVQLSSREKNVFKKIAQFQWIVFTSPNGIQFFFRNLAEIVGNKNIPENTRLAVIGNKTNQVLNQMGFQATFINPGSTGEDFARAFILKLKGEKRKPNVLLALGDLARTVIQEQIKDFAHVTRVNLYETIIPDSIDKEIMQAILNEQYEMLLFTSPSGVRNFMKLLNGIDPKKIRMACIGETTASAAIENNISPLVVAKNSTAQGLFDSVLNFYKK